MCSIRGIAVRVLVALLPALYAIHRLHQWISSYRPEPLSTKETTTNTDGPPHQLTWREPFAYDVAIYASHHHSFYDDQSHFFSDAQHVATLRDIKLLQNSHNHNRLLLHTRARIRKAASTNSTLYLHLFMQEAGKMNPHPSMEDKLIVQAHTRLLILSHSTPGGSVVVGRSRVAWEAMLDNHLFANRQMPVDVRRMSVMQYYSPSERRAYSPIAWDNPLVALGDARRQNMRRLRDSKNENKANGIYGGGGGGGGNGNNSKQFVEVTVTLRRVSLEWMRIVGQFVRSPLDPFASVNTTTTAAASNSRSEAADLAAYVQPMDRQKRHLVAILERLAEYSTHAMFVLGGCWALGIAGQALALAVDAEAGLFLLAGAGMGIWPRHKQPRQRRAIVIAVGVGLLHLSAAAVEVTRIIEQLFAHSNQPPAILLPGSYNFVFATSSNNNASVSSALWLLQIISLALPAIATTTSNIGLGRCCYDRILARQISLLVAWTADTVLGLVLLPNTDDYDNNGHAAALAPVALLAITTAYLAFKRKHLETTTKTTTTTTRTKKAI